MRMVLVDCQDTLLREIATPELKRKDIAMTYRLAMESGETVDWSVVNKAIIERWSVPGLVWIKTQAHSGACFGSKRE